MPLLSLLCILWTLSEGPSSGRHSINIFLICIELPVPVFLQKTALLAPTPLETLEQMPTLFYFCLPLILLVRSSRNFLCVSSPLFSCQCANTHHESYLFHRTHCVSPTNCASLLFWIPSVVCLYFSNALHYIYFHALSYINYFCTFESQWFKIFALCVFLPMWWWLSNSILNKHPFQFYEMGKIKIWPISQGNSHHHLLCESILQTVKFYEPFNEYVVILVGLHALAQLSGRNRHKYLVDIKFNQMFGWQPYMSWFRNPSSVHLETLQSSRIYGPNLEGTFIMPTQIPLARTHP